MENKIQKKQIIIGLHGKIGSGKDTFGQLLIKNTKNLQRKAFADNLKIVVAILTGIDVEKLHDQTFKNSYCDMFNMTYGEVLQKVGTNYLRQFDDKIWIKSTFASMSNDINYVITDTRFKNEAQYVKNNGGILIKTVGDPLNVRQNSNRDLNHQSEIDLDDWTDWDEIIENDSTLEELENKAKLIIQKYF